MKKSVVIKQIVLVLMLIAVLALVSCSCRGCGFINEDITTTTLPNDMDDGVSTELEVIEELFVDIEQDYVDENGIISIEEAPQLINSVYEEVQESEAVTYCEKNDFSVYMILDNGIGVHYNAPVEGLLSSGNEIAIYSYQPFYDKFNEFFDIGGWYPDKGIEELLELDITTSGTQLKNEDVTIESLKQMKGDSVIVWVSHGGYSNKYHSSLCLYVPYSTELYRTYEDDFLNHRIEMSYTKEGGMSVCVTSLFFDYYLSEGALDNSIIFLSACYSGKDGVLATTLMNKGATAVYAYSDTVKGIYADKTCRTVLETLSDGYTVDEALEKAKEKHGDKDNLIFGLWSTECELFVTYRRNITLNDLYETIEDKKGDKSSGLNFTLNSDGNSYSVTGIGTCTDTDIVIPSTYNGLPVTRIANDAFNNSQSFTSVNIPDTVTSIGERAFAWCQSLTSVNIPDSVTSIGEGAFGECLLLSNIFIPESITSIGDSTFYACQSLTSITIPNGVTSIGQSAFYACTSLTNIVISNSVKNIDAYAFSGCTSLASIYIPKGVKTIGNSAFSGCTSLTSVGISDSLTEIPDNAFTDCEQLKTVIISDSVTSIGYKAFYNCPSLAHIQFTSSVESIGELAFGGCGSLSTIDYIGKIKQWYDIQKFTNWDIATGNYVVYCNDGTISKSDSGANGNASEGLEFTLNDDGKSYSVTGIGTCTDTNVVIPSEYNGLPVTKIGDFAFAPVNLETGEIYSSSLRSVTIPNSVTSIGELAFAFCESLTSIEIPDSVTSIDMGAFGACSSLETIKLSNSIDKISGALFADCSSLKEITIPDSVQSIGVQAFLNCTSLTSVVIPNSVAEILTDAFEGCTSLTSVTIGNSVTNIGIAAFSYCTSLKSIKIEGTIELWESIEKGKGWNYPTGDFTVYCTDGTITKDGIVTYYQ